jgi:predicted ATPase/class 3 adenylate cyclase
MKCPKCQFDNRKGVKFCEKCGAKMELACPNCAAKIPLDRQFCGDCGQALDVSPLTGQTPDPKPQTLPSESQSPRSYTPPHLAERILAEQAAMEVRGVTEGERKTITALFADIKGSMELMEEIDPEEARLIIDPALKLMMDAVHRYEGYVAQSLGDGIFALFGAPISHEDHPQRALYAALRMQEQSRRYADRLRVEKGVPIQLRVGLNTGEVVVRSIQKDDLNTDYVPVGYSTGLAARMESLATPGSIVVSEHTFRLTEGFFEFKALGATQVKGATEPVRIFEVVGVGPLRNRLQMAARRGLLKFVGRQREIKQMIGALEKAKGGHGQMVAAMGEAGVGKSRLVYEFKLLSKEGCLVLETFSVSHGKAYPYLPLIELLKNYFQITPEDDERRRREKVGGKVLMLDRALEDTLPYLFSLLGVEEPSSSLQQMDPQVRRRRTFEAIKRLLVRESLNQPLILIFEDLHWIDSETETFLILLRESLATSQILLLVNYRPEYRHEWGSKTYYAQMRLDPLGGAEAQELLTALLGDGSGLQSLKHLLLEKTEGNPFFMEEIVQTLAEEKLLVGERGNYHLEKAPTELHISPTVQGVLTARIDRLGAEEKELLQTLAVVGKEFSVSLLGKLVKQSEEELFQLLSRLQGGEFIYEQQAFPEVEYTFKHALTQEVVYSSVLTERRRDLHERTAQAIEEVFSNRLEEHSGELAHHYSRSGNVKKAVEYLKIAGQQAVQRSANAEAVSHLTSALELLKTLPDTPERNQQELTLQITLGAPLAATKGHGAAEVEKVYTRARKLCQQVGETPQLFPVLFGLWRFYNFRAELQTAREIAEELMGLACNVQNPGLLLQAHRVLGAALFYHGEFGPSQEQLEQAIALYDSQEHRSLAFFYGIVSKVYCLTLAAYALWLLGYPEQALKKMKEALTLAQGLSHPYSLAFALSHGALLHQYRRELQTTQQQAEAAIVVCTEQGFSSWLAMGTILRGWTMAGQEKEEEGIAQMRQGLAAYRDTGAALRWPYYISLLADAYGKEGQPEEGLNTLAEALSTVNKTGERWYEAELFRLKGELLMKSEIQRMSEAETCFRQAIDITRRQSAKSLELRAATSLSRLWQQQGKKTQAQDKLAEIYGWFTEGLDTPDLKEAKALLEEIS